MGTSTGGGPSRALWFVRLGIVAIVVVLLFALARWSGWWVLLLPAVIITYAAVSVSMAAARGTAAIHAFRAEHPGKDLLLAYSDNPQWNDRIATTWAARWGARAVIVRLPERDPPEGQMAAVALFRSVAGQRGHNPVAIIVPPSGRIEVIRLRSAFGESARGDDSALRAAEARVDRALGMRTRDQDNPPV